MTDVPPKIGRSSSEKRIKKGDGTSLDGIHEGAPGIIHVSRRSSKVYSANELQTNHHEGTPGNMSRRSSKRYSANELQSDRNEEVVYSNHMNIVCINLKLEQLLTDRQSGATSQGFNAFEEDAIPHSLPYRKTHKGRSMMSIMQSPSYGMLNMSANLSNNMVGGAAC
jgi:hypothetical protein